jgi:hypothetical protein
LVRLASRIGIERKPREVEDLATYIARKYGDEPTEPTGSPEIEAGSDGPGSETSTPDGRRAEAESSA